MGRESILKSIRKNKPAFISAPEINEEAFKEDVNLIEAFKNNVAFVGGTIIEIKNESIDDKLRKRFPNISAIVSTSEKSSLGNISLSENTDPHNLQNIDLAIIEGEFGVSENGGIWVTADSILVRALPFITNDLVIILDKTKICLHMLEAYDLIAQRERNFGVFISGPSKTADIEQCLVVGAQGAMSLTVILV